MKKITANKIKRKLTKIKDGIFGVGKCYHLPEAIQIETTIRCNLKCATCDNELKFRTKNRDMSFEDFCKLIKQLPDLSELNLTGYGEPLLNKEIFRMVKFAKQRDIYTYYSTNATLLNEDISKKMLESGQDLIIFSIDSAIPAHYNEIRAGADFYAVKENIKKFMHLRTEMKSNIKVEIYSVVTSDHVTEIKALVDLAKELGVGTIRLRGLADHTGKSKEFFSLALYHPDNRENSQKYIDEAIIYGEKLGIKIFFPSLSPRTNFICSTPFFRPYISVEGCLTPCCLQGLDPRRINFGKIFDIGFSKAWNSREYRLFRRRLAGSKNVPEICTYCPRRHGMA